MKAHVVVPEQARIQRQPHQQALTAQEGAHPVTWKERESCRHSSLLEALAMFRILRIFKPSLQKEVNLVQTDNTMVLSHSNRLGGTRFHWFNHIFQEVTLCCLSRETTLWAVHLADCDKVDTDLSYELNEY